MAQAQARRQKDAGVLVMDLAQALQRILEAGTEEMEQARAALDEAKEALTGKEDVTRLLHQWITGTRGGKNVLAGGNLVGADEYFPSSSSGRPRTTDPKMESRTRGIKPSQPGPRPSRSRKMPTVYVVTRDWYSDHHVQAVFSSREKAEEFVKHFDPEDTDIHKFPLDEPDPARTELFFTRAAIDRRGEQVAEPLMRMMDRPPEPGELRPGFRVSPLAEAVLRDRKRRGEAPAGPGYGTGLPMP